MLPNTTTITTKNNRNVHNTATITTNNNRRAAHLWFFWFFWFFAEKPKYVWFPFGFFGFSKKKPKLTKKTKINAEKPKRFWILLQKTKKTKKIQSFAPFPFPFKNKNAKEQQQLQ